MIAENVYPQILLQNSSTTFFSIKVIISVGACELTYDFHFHARRDQIENRRDIVCLTAAKVTAPLASKGQCAHWTIM